MKDLIIFICRQLWKEMKDHPITLFVILAVLLGGTYFHFTHASDEVLQQHMEQDRVIHVETKDSLDFLKEMALADTLYGLNVRWCKADAAGRREMKPAIDRYESEYFKITHRDYEMVPCSEMDDDA